jgi:vanillate O-demethylase monooxygenase subunit
MMFLRDAWYVVASAEELTRGPLGRTVLGEPLVIFRVPGGTVGAMSDACPHRLARLSRGCVTNAGIRCAYHSFEFALDGRCVSAPGAKKIPPLSTVRTYPVEERFGWVWLWMGDPARQDPELIPRSIAPFAAGGWTHARGYTHVQGNYELLADNLLDGSHADSVHPGTLGSHFVKEYQIALSTEGRDLIVEHLSRDNAPTGLFEFLMRATEPVDQWVRSRWTPPSTLVLDVGSTLSGQPRSRGVHVININCLTPETATSTHYFWSVARDFANEDAAMTEQIRTMTSQAFDQDRVLIESQQQLLGTRDLRDFRLASTPNDTAPNRARMMLKRLVEQEAAR